MKKEEISVSSCNVPVTKKNARNVLNVRDSLSSARDV